VEFDQGGQRPRVGFKIDPPVEDWQKRGRGVLKKSEEKTSQKMHQIKKLSGGSLRSVLGSRIKALDGQKVSKKGNQRTGGGNGQLSKRKVSVLGRDFKKLALGKNGREKNRKRGWS